MNISLTPTFLQEWNSETFINIFIVLSFYCYEIPFCQFSIKRILDWTGVYQYIEAGTRQRMIEKLTK